MVDEVCVLRERANERMLVHEIEARLLGFVPLQQSADDTQAIGAVTVGDAASTIDLVAGVPRRRTLNKRRSAPCSTGLVFSRGMCWRCVLKRPGSRLACTAIDCCR